MFWLQPIGVRGKEMPVFSITTATINSCGIILKAGGNRDSIYMKYLVIVICAATKLYGHSTDEAIFFWTTGSYPRLHEHVQPIMRRDLYSGSYSIQFQFRLSLPITQKHSMLPMYAIPLILREVSFVKWHDWIWTYHSAILIASVGRQ
jgi:hypothetical protein